MRASHFSLSLSLSVYIFLSLCLSLSFSFSRCLSLCLSFFLSLSVCICLSVCLSVSFSLFLFLSLSFSLFLFLSLSLFLTVYMRVTLYCMCISMLGLSLLSYTLGGSCTNACLTKCMWAWWKFLILVSREELSISFMGVRDLAVATTGKMRLSSDPDGGLSWKPSCLFIRTGSHLHFSKMNVEPPTTFGQLREWRDMISHPCSCN